ncbi:MAG: hypothetical protein Q7S74_06270 [Nanoarchaeota archaeon]|nr:hypothetical protein [Nanoarchaeota archaeon]
MNRTELTHLFIAVIMFTIIGALSFIFKGDIIIVIQVFLFSIIIIVFSVFAKKLIAYSLDANVEHKIWGVYRYGFREHNHFKKEAPAGIFLPLFFSIFTLGLIKIPAFLTYETRALKSRAAKRFGFYSYSEMTDWHNGLIGAAGIVMVLLISFVGYLLGYEYLAKLAAYYAFFNMIPISNLDGTQILFGSRVIWTALALVCVIFTAYALLLGI